MKLTADSIVKMFKKTKLEPKRTNFYSKENNKCYKKNNGEIVYHGQIKDKQAGDVTSSETYYN